MGSFNETAQNSCYILKFLFNWHLTHLIDIWHLTQFCSYPAGSYFYPNLQIKEQSLRKMVWLPKPFRRQVPELSPSSPCTSGSQTWLLIIRTTGGDFFKVLMSTLHPLQVGEPMLIPLLTSIGQQKTICDDVLHENTHIFKWEGVSNVYKKEMVKVQYFPI